MAAGRCLRGMRAIDAAGAGALWHRARAKLQGSQTDAVLGRHASEIKQGQRDQADEDRAQAQDEATNLREFRADKKAAPFRRARQQVIQASQQGGFGTPNDAQADDMARQVISLTEQGVATNQAILGRG